MSYRDILRHRITTDCDMDRDKLATRLVTEEA